MRCRSATVGVRGEDRQVGSATRRTRRSTGRISRLPRPRPRARRTDDPLPLLFSLSAPPPSICADAVAYPKRKSLRSAMTRAGHRVPDSLRAPTRFQAPRNPRRKTARTLHGTRSAATHPLTLRPHPVTSTAAMAVSPRITRDKARFPARLLRLRPGATRATSSFALLREGKSRAK